MNTTAPETATQAGPTATAPPEGNPAKRPTKKRVRNFTADDRAAHRIFERGRREAFKERLIELAAQLPALTDTDPQRLSKHVVVDESIARHKLLENRCLDALRGIRQLMQERDDLLAEVNNWRRSSGANPRQPKSIVVNIEGLSETEKDLQRRASAARLSQTTTRRSSDQPAGPPDDEGQAATTTNSQSDDAASQVPRGLPTEPTQDAHAVSELDGLLLDAPWPPQVAQPRPAQFNAESTMESLAMSDQGDAMQPNALPDQMPVSAPDLNDYQLLGNMNSHQQDSYSNMNSLDFSAADSASFDASHHHMPLSPSYLASTSMPQGMPFQQQQWVSWPG